MAVSTISNPLTNLNYPIKHNGSVSMTIVGYGEWTSASNLVMVFAFPFITKDANYSYTLQSSLNVFGVGAAQTSQITLDTKRHTSIRFNIAMNGTAGSFAFGEMTIKISY